MKTQENRSGLTDAQVEESRRLYGKNLLTPPKQTPWWKLYLEKFKDPIIVILLVATAISLIFGIIHGDFTESLGIIFAVVIATGVGFWQEYSAKRKFDAMRSDQDYEPVKVRRNGVVVETTKDQLVVGDVVILSAGDEIPADIRLFQASDMKVSESAMTGESVPVSKYPIDEPYMGSGFSPDFLLRGTLVSQGAGEGVVERVGDSTEIGQTTRKASEETNNVTPLQQQLNGLAKRINVIAFVIAGLMFLILNLVHWIPYEGAAGWEEILLTEVRFLMSAVVVVIVAVPEGLPLSVTMALAFSMKTMARENNLVKKMHACETVGAVDVIFTDKTGTLTQNSMTVVEADIVEGCEETLALVGALNSTANWSGRTVLGNPTESAILKFLGEERTTQLRGSHPVRIVIPFSSAYKYMLSETELDGHRLLMLKGAPEVVARIIRNDSYLPLVAEQQERGRRAIAAAVVTDGDAEAVKATLERGESLSEARYVGTWFIEDPVRPDVPHAIEQCYGAGIDVVMMTGDNIKTGSEIARQSGFRNIWAIEAKDFMTAVTQPQGGREFPNVITRCTPNDKLEILRWTQGHGHVCAMTGDGVNDSPTLNYADVGIAMGSGTSAAKEAADIVLLDDAFPSIVTGVKWGRSLYKNIKNFLYFQLSINVSACLIAVFGPIVGVEMPFTVTQFLWINIVMDSLAAIALASEPADERVLKDRPRDRREFIINRPLATAIFGFGGFIWLLCTVVLWGMEHGMPLVQGIDRTVFFAGYMVLNWWNLFNARVIGKGMSVFSHLGRNPKFIGVAALVLIATIFIVQVGGEVFQTHPLDTRTWIMILLITSPVMIVRELWYQLNRNRRR